MNMTQAVSEFRQFEKAMRGVFAIGDLLKEGVNLEAVLAQTKKATDAAVKEREKAEQVRDATNEAIATANESLKKVQVQVVQLLANSRDDQNAMKKRAEADAAKVMASAHTDANALKMKVEQDRVNHEKKVDEWRQEAETKHAEIKVIRETLDKLRNRIG